jgi:hypothetical protein
MFDVDQARWSQSKEHQVITETPLQTWLAFVRQPRGDTWVTPEDKQHLAEQHTAEIAKRRIDFNATIN